MTEDKKTKKSWKIDLHRHLDGNVRPLTVWELAQKNGVTLPVSGPEGVRDLIVVKTPQPGLMEFLGKLEWMVKVLASPEDCERVAYENMVDAAAEGLDYLELRFSPAFMAAAFQLDYAEVAEAVVKGIHRGSKALGLPVGIIGILSRTYGPEQCWLEWEALHQVAPHLVALDLAGDEAGWPARLFGEHFWAARQAGLRATVHAGEAAGPDSIWEALEILGAERIGHAVRATEDPVLMQHLQSREIGLECNLTSNLQTSTVANYASHPLRRFLHEGLLATINTDDPGVSGIDLQYELTVAASAAGLNQAEIAQAADNAARVAFAFDPGEA